MVTKACSRCSVLKLLDQFYSDSNPKNKTGKQSRCIDCCKQDAARYRKANPARKAEWDRAYRKRYPEKDRELYARKRKARPDHYKQLAAERQRRYRERNPGAGLKGNAERLRRWRMKHPERERAWQMGRKAEHLAPAWGSPELIKIVYQKAREFGFEVDHVVPLKHPLVCGLHVWPNLQLLDLNLNRAKRNFAWPDMPGAA